MQLSDWQFDRLRRALNNYRILYAYDGHLLSWEGVQDDLLDSGFVAAVSAEVGEKLSLKAEALRRFSLSFSTLSFSKIEVLRRFLVSEKLLGPTELEDGPAEMRNLLVLASHLANDGEPVRRELERIGSKHRAVRTIGDIQMSVELLKTVDQKGPYLRIEETITSTETISPERHQHYAKDYKKLNITRTESRVGYGLLSTPANQFHIFLCGAAPDDRVTYLEMSPRREDSHYADMHLIRTGDFGKESLGILKDGDQQEQYYWGGLLQFVPAWAL